MQGYRCFRNRKNAYIRIRYIYAKKREVKMDITISPGKLSGNVSVPSSKSISHRALICAALANGTSHIKNISKSDDIDATINVMKALGARFSTDENTIVSEG